MNGSGGLAISGSRNFVRKKAAGSVLPAGEIFVAACDFTAAFDRGYQDP
jgi:hypothetical protein